MEPMQVLHETFLAIGSLNVLRFTLNRLDMPDDSFANSSMHSNSSTLDFVLASSMS